MRCLLLEVEKCVMKISMLKMENYDIHCCLYAFDSGFSFELNGEKYNWPFRLLDQEEWVCGGIDTFSMKSLQFIITN